MFVCVVVDMFAYPGMPPKLTTHPEAGINPKLDRLGRSGCLDEVNRGLKAGLAKTDPSFKKMRKEDLDAS